MNDDFYRLKCSFKHLFVKLLYIFILYFGGTKSFLDYFSLQEMRREEFLVTRLMRQSQQERRIATQLLQLRHEKAVIQQNRISRQEQYEERRQKDFQEALDKEAVCDCQKVWWNLQSFSDYTFTCLLVDKYQPHCRTPGGVSQRS